MARIFLSYRRQDSAGVAGRIYDRLRAHFGDDAIFMDIDSIPLGDDFRTHIDAAVGQCDLVLAVIGPKWTGDDAHRRLDDPRDFVRVELESALLRNLPVIPILIDDARMPAESELPQSISALTFRNAIDVDQGRDFHPHVDRLVRGIELQLERLKARAANPSSSSPETTASPTLAKEPLRSPRRTGPERVAEPTPDSPGRLARATAAQVEGASPKQSITPRLLLCGAALVLVIVLSLIIFNATDTGTARVTGTNLAKPESPSPKAVVETKPAAPITKAPSTGLTELPDTKKHEPSGPDRAAENTSTAATAKAPDPKPSPSGPAGAAEPKSTAATTKDLSPKPSPAQTGREWTNSVGMRFVPIEAGEFMMGTTKDQVEQLLRVSPESKPTVFVSEQPQHSVRISRPFLLGIHEVTQRQYQAVMGTNPSVYKGSDDLPAESMKWLDAVGFCNKLSEREQRSPYYRIKGEEVTLVGGNGYRLPTEAEWEYACRAKSVTLYPFGDDASKSSEHAWNSTNANSETHPVGQKLPNAWGLYDMLGNVSEWCTDGFDEKYYTSSPLADPSGVSGALPRVIRGGAWLGGPLECRSAYRLGYLWSYKDVGFRVARAQD